MLFLASIGLLTVPKSQLKTRSGRAFLIQAPRLWNTLPFCIRSLSAFKSSLKTYLFLFFYLYVFILLFDDAFVDFLLYCFFFFQKDLYTACLSTTFTFSFFFVVVVSLQDDVLFYVSCAVALKSHLHLCLCKMVTRTLLQVWHQWQQTLLLVLKCLVTSSCNM